MLPGTAPRRWAGASSTLALALACALIAAGTAEAAIAPGGGVLSPRLAELAKPSVRNAPPAEQARKLSLAAEGPGSLLRDGNRVLAEVRFDQGAAASVEDLRGAGAKIVNVSQHYQTVTVAVKPEKLLQLSAVPRISGVREVLTPLSFASQCPSGNVVSEGDWQLHAAEARSAFGVDGSGVTVGILSDSFDKATEAIEGGPIATHEAEDVANGDLPGSGNTCAGETAPVNTILDNYVPGPEDPAPADEGRAMGQIVHDLAPGAKLAFATAFNGETAFAENIERLARPSAVGGAGANVVVDDVAYFDEPFFQDGPVADAISRVTSEGTPYFTAAGNDNLIDEENEIASWEAPEFRDAESCPVGAPSYANQCMNFSPGGKGPTDTGFRITIEPEATLTVDLQWKQPWEGVTTDLDAYLLRGGAEVAASEYPNTDKAIQEPVEILSWTNPEEESVNVELAINRCDTVCGTARAIAHSAELGGTTGGDSGTPLLKFALLENGGGVSSTEYPTSSEGDTVGPTVFGHAGAASAISVGAVPYFDSSEPEYYSSRGPVTHYFGPVEAGSAAPELSVPEVIKKPDLVATDCGRTTFFARFFRFFNTEPKAWHFCGTSAAAPHAAAVAALMLQRNPSISPAQIRSDLVSTARPVGTFGPDAVGSGLIDAVGALGAVTPPPAPSPAAAVPISTPPSRKVIPPRAFIRKHPPAVIRTRRSSVKVVFRFGADQPGVTFLCDVDGGPFHPCPARFVHRFGLGRHTVRVKARNAAGVVGAAAVFRFQVKRRRGA